MQDVTANAPRIKGAHGWGVGEAAGLQTPQNRNLRKKTDFVYVVRSNILRDFPFSQNQPMKSADDQYIRILKNKLIKLKNRKTGHCDWVTERVVMFVCIYIQLQAALCCTYSVIFITELLKSNINYIQPQGQPLPPPQGKYLGAHLQ
jgi:hypothetical protein